MSPVMKGGSGVIAPVGGHLDLHSSLFGCDEEEEGHESDLRARYCSFSPSVLLPFSCGCLGNFWLKN